MARRRKYKIPKMTSSQRWVFVLMNIVAVFIMGLAAMNALFGWDWNKWLMAILMMLTSFWLLVQGGWKVVAKLGKTRLKTQGYIHLLSLILGFALLFVSFCSLPPIGALMSLNNYIAPIAVLQIVSIVVAILEIFV